MRIAYITTDYGVPVFGNKDASIHVREMATALETLGHDVHIFTPCLGGEPPDGFYVPVSEVSFGLVQEHLVNIMKAGVLSPDPAMKEIRPLLYGVMLVQEILPDLETWRPDAIYERYSPMSTAGVDLARRFGIPHILEVNMLLTDEAEEHHDHDSDQTACETERMILQEADHVLAVSDGLRDWLVISGVDPERITVTPTPVNTDRFARTAQTSPEHPTVGFGWEQNARAVESLIAAPREALDASMR